MNISVTQMSPERQEEIVSYNLEQLTQKLQSGELKAVEVLQAYQKQVHSVSFITMKISFLHIPHILCEAEQKK